MSLSKIKSHISKHNKVNTFRTTLDTELPILKSEVKKRKNVKVVKKHLIFSMSLILLIAIVVGGISFYKKENVLITGFRRVLASAGIYTEPISNIEIQSDNWKDKEPGSWHIDKSSAWVGPYTAEINFQVNSIELPNTDKKDVILVFDVSGSMSGEKLNNLKKESVTLVNKILANENNKVALIAFDTNAEILSSFTNDKSVLASKINALTAKVDTNYNSALLKVDEVLNDYVFDLEKDLVTLFLTDGYPNIDNPRQVGTYEVLKTKYPDMIINGIQYEMGTEPIEQVKQISDNQFIAESKNLADILHKAVYMPETYDSFVVEDYIDTENFYIDSQTEINTTIGNARIEEENGELKIIWDFGTNYEIGDTQKLTFRVDLKEEYREIKGLYSTNTKEKVITKLKKEDEKEVISKKTPVLKNYYSLTYLVNTPKGCNLKAIPKSDHFVFENVTKNKDELTCDGYLFQGWEFENKKIEEINSEVFVMPTEDVVARAIWSKPVIAKSVDGTIHEKSTLYKEIKKDVETDSTIAAIYTGNGADTFANDIYYYKLETKNNVIFGQDKDGNDMCWQIMRTTETGGIKILYNGLASDDGSCNNKGAAQQAFTNAFNSEPNSIAYLGYMYNKVYKQENRAYRLWVVLFSNSTLTLGMWYGDDYILDQNTGGYTLVNPKVIDENTNYQDLAGKYTFYSKNENVSLNYVDYLVGVDDTTGYFIQLNNKKELEQVDTSLAFADSYIDNGNGTYTLDPATTKWIKKSDWYKNYSDYDGKYTCAGNFTTCTGYVRLTSNTTKNSFDVETPTDVFKYANSFTYDENTGKYKLTGEETTFWKWRENYNKLNNTHYTCLNETGECETLYYVFNTSETSADYFALTGGSSIDDLLNDMLYSDDVNKVDSVAKIALEQWYEENLLDYGSYLEDTVFCNDRRISNIGAFNPNGGSVSGGLSFVSTTSGYSDLTCPNLTDQFSSTTTVGNGKLKYPIGLATISEVNLMSASFRNTGVDWRLMSPYTYGAHAFGSGVWNGGYPWQYSVYVSSGFRPSVSLRHDIEYISGDGTVNNPYIIKQ